MRCSSCNIERSETRPVGGGAGVRPCIRCGIAWCLDCEPEICGCGLQTCAGLRRAAARVYAMAKVQPVEIPIRDVNGNVVGKGVARRVGDRVLLDGVILASPEKPALVDPDAVAEDARAAVSP